MAQPPELAPPVQSAHGHSDAVAGPSFAAPPQAPEDPAKTSGGVKGSSEQEAIGGGAHAESLRLRHSEEELQAALLIQKHYRGHAARRRVKRMHLEKEARWDELVKAQNAQSSAEGQLNNKNDVRSRWQRGMQAASRLQDGEGLHDSTTLPDGTKACESDETTNLTPEVKRMRRATFWGSLTLGVSKEKDEARELPYTSKSLEQQHWLEMIDGKHRYGSNLKYYFRKWKESDTSDNFFRWLDRGEGKDLDLEELPRERLEKEKITYLSAEQRLNYLVKVDKDGLLRWARNSELVDTAAGKWRDSGDGSGIIPDETWKELHPEEAKREAELYRAGSRDSSSSDISISSTSTGWSAQSGLQENEATHYDEYTAESDKGWLGRKVEGITPAGIKKQLLRKTVRRNTWIYVSDMKLNMFIGIKQTGKFQHSSFLAGGKVTSAGIIVVKHGLVKSLNPWSGHYRSSIDAYRSFIGQLENKGVDLSHVKVGKSVMLMWGLTKAAKVKKGRGDFSARFRKALHLPHEPTEAEKSEEVQRNAEKEEAKHQAKIRELREAEDAQETDEDRLRVRKEILYGRKRDVIQDADGTRHSPIPV